MPVGQAAWRGEPAPKPSTAGRSSPSSAAQGWRMSWSVRTAPCGLVAKNLRDRDRRAGRARLARSRDCVFCGRAGQGRLALLGATRLEIGRCCGLIDESDWRFLWVKDAPLSSRPGRGRGRCRRRRGAWTAVHHASPARPREFVDDFETRPGEALAYAYDMVLNGNEIGGGSIRINVREVQERVFRVMGLTADEGAGEVRASCLDAFSSARHRTAASPSAGTGSSCCGRLRQHSRCHRLPSLAAATTRRAPAPITPSSGPRPVLMPARTRGRGRR